MSEKISEWLDPWIESGDIVLEAKGKYFRVHRSILTQCSEVFKGMFDSLEISEGEHKLVEQCRVVRLRDTAADLQVLLKAMYDKSPPKSYAEKIPFSVVSALLRLGKKYVIHQFYDEAKAKLCCAFEFTLVVASQISKSKNGALQLFPGVEGDPFNFDIMNLLENMDLKASLPLAMYQCALICPSSAIIDCYSFRGSRCMLSKANHDSLRGVVDILKNFRDRLENSLDASHDGCISHPPCRHHIRRYDFFASIDKQPFCPWKRKWDKLFCDPCRTALKAEHRAAMEDAWNQIPRVFHLNDWAAVARSGDFPPSPYASDNFEALRLDKNALVRMCDNNFFMF